MIDRLYIQMQAMQKLSRAQEVTADNLANINTPGFKGTRLFHRLLTEQVHGKQITKTVPMQQVNMKQGMLEPTGNAFDIGIDGDGFFVVQDEDGESMLTRDGRFHINSDGYLVNSQGANVMGSGGPIYLPEYFQVSGQQEGGAELQVAKDGTIRINNEIQDKLRLVEVDDPSNLKRHGFTYFSADTGSLTKDESSTVMQGYYEKGNVEPLTEMVDMMSNMQMFKAQQRAMQTTDDMLSRITSRLGRF